jgi:molybdenum cofactor cytidylyltransferase
MQTFAVIPAAGRSQRMGRPKLLLPWGERTVIEQVIDTWRASRVDRIVMVAHPQDDMLAELGRQRGAIVVQPDVPPDEMKTSVRIAMARIAEEYAPQDEDAWLLAPADMPTLSSDTIDRLIDAHRASLSVPGVAQPTIWAPVAGERRGHPVLFPWSLAEDVERLGADEGLNALLRRYPVRTVEADAASILEDLDTPQDYQRLRRREGPSGNEAGE